jgi:gliding motility-associated-like protein
MYPYILPNGIRANPGNCYDNSPRFLASPTSVICSDYKFYYNHLAGDVELDSLWYAWDYPISTSGGTRLTFAPGYSFDAPFPDQTENAANGPVTLDGTTGQMTVEAYNPLPGNYVSVVKVEAWKNCQLKAEVYRDLAVVYSTHPDCANNNPPQTLIDLNAWPSVQKRGDNYYTAVYPGDTVRFRMLATETDLNGVQLQSISMKAVNDELGNPYHAQTGCLSGKTPCATLTRIGAGDFDDELLQIEGEFLWVPGCSHLAAERGCRGLASSYPFAFRVQDNACPANGIGAITVVVDVLRGDPNTPSLQCLNLSQNDEVTLQWGQPAIDSGLFYAYYLVYADSGNGNFGPVDTIYDYNQLSTVISPNMVPTGVTAPNSYYVVLCDTSRAGCEFFSVPSDTLSPMVVHLTQPTGGRSDTLHLEWNAQDARQLLNYEVWAEIPARSGNWRFFSQGTNTSLNSYISACNDTARFQIRVTHPSGCVSTSNISNEGRFTDTLNRDVLVIDSVTVSQASGLTNISWAGSTAPDVVSYIIMFNDPNTGWTVIDTVPLGTPMPYEWANSQAADRAEAFRVISLDSCGNQSDDRAVVAHRTVQLRDYLNKCEGYLRLSWNAYQGFKGGVGEYRIYYVETDVNGITGPRTLAFTGNANDTVRRINNLNGGSEYCFIVQAFDTSGLVSSSSNEVCVNASVTIKSKELYIAQITNNPGRGSIDMKVFVDGTADVSLFAIERALDRFGPWKNIATVGKPTAAPYLIRFSDFGADPSNAYYYRVIATDSCGLRDTVSNIGRNLVVYPRSNENLTNSLTWTPYQAWDGAVGMYDIYRSVDNGASFTKVGTNDGGDTTFTDNISAFSNERVNFCYYVIATEINNPLNYVDDNGQPFTSLSNTACIEQKVKMFMPNAFRPNSNVIDNQTFGPSLRFDDVSRYSLLVMNRWGTVVFETTDPLERWDGTYQGEPMPSGVYIYKLQYAGIEEVLQEDMGSFTLLR